MIEEYRQQRLSITCMGICLFNKADESASAKKLALLLHQEQVNTYWMKEVLRDCLGVVWPSQIIRVEKLRDEYCFDYLPVHCHFYSTIKFRQRECGDQRVNLDRTIFYHA